MSAKPYRVLVADDHAVVRHGIRAILETQPGVEVCAEASNGIEAMEHVRKGKPDLVVLDLTMPEMNGLEVARALRQEMPDVDVLVLTMHFAEEVAREVLRCGAKAYVLKSDADTELVTAVQNLRQRKPYFTGRLAASMAASFVHSIKDGSAASLVPDTPLTPREIEIVQLLAEGKSNKEAAAVLSVSTRTVESHRTHIMRKMNFKSFSDLVRFAIRNSLVAP